MVDVTGHRGRFVVTESGNLVASFLKVDYNEIQFYSGAGDDELTNNTPRKALAYGSEGNDYLIGGNASDWLNGSDYAADQAITLDREYHFRSASNYSYN